MSRSSPSIRPWIDTDEFTRAGGQLSGELPLASMSRLADLLTDHDGRLSWQLVGERTRRVDGGVDPYLALTLAGKVRVRCVRCLEPVGVEIEEHRHYRLVPSESIAQRDDAQSEDVDLLVSSPRFEVVDLVEDEAIMAIPPAPRHADCQPPASETAGRPTSSPAAGASPAGRRLARVHAPHPSDESVPVRPNPFAALAHWKRQNPGDPDRDD